jgi:pyruvate dehydrogenase E1 component alpha subunit
LNASELTDFENEIAELFNSGKIRAPIHLESGNEFQLIEVFKKISNEDWVCCSWRSHLKCLLKGVPPEILRSRILAGGSIALCFPSHRIVSSAIVGGILPIAVGLAMGMKRRGEAARVHCFVGDMTAKTGMFDECMRYASGHMLNIRWVVEDNGLSVCTPTRDAWGETLPGMSDTPHELVSYHYESRYPHAGSGTRINF